MQLEYNMAFTKTKIICHGARATRLGERLLRHMWNNITDCKKDEIFNSFSLLSLINYPQDLEKIDTGCDKIVQIVYGNSQMLNEAIQLSQEKFKQKKSDLIVIGSIEQKIENITCINVEESEIIDTFLGIFKNLSMNYSYQKLLEMANSDKNKGQTIVSKYLKGEKYDEDKTKLLVIGRALNGWSKSFITSNIEDFNTLWERQEKGEVDFLCNSRFSDKGKTKLTLIQAKGLEWVKSYIKKENGKRFYRTENTSFWSVVREITEFLHNGQLKEGEWTNHIAWTNLAKIAPLDGGNPSKELWDVQHDISKEILSAELEKLEPTHILVIAKSNKESDPQKDSWTKGYYEILESYKNKHNVKIAYMYRPEYKKRSIYISDTKKAFNID